MKSSDGHWREVRSLCCASVFNYLFISHSFLSLFVQWTDSSQDVSELLNLLKSNKLWNRRFACSAIWSLGRAQNIFAQLICFGNVSAIDAMPPHFSQRVQASWPAISSAT